jgi:hypothetical protein
MTRVVEISAEFGGCASSGRGEMGDRVFGFHWRLAGITAIAGAFFLSTAVDGLGQTPDPARGESVLNRFENAEPPPGIQVGGFLLTPTAKAELRYDDNIFVDNSNREGDFITSGGAGARLKSNFVRHGLDFYGSIEGSHYLDNDSEDFWEGIVGTRGRLDVHRELQLSTDLWLQRATDPRDSPDNVNGTEPSVFHVYHASTAMQAGVAGPLVSRLELGFERITNEPVPSSVGTIDTSERDHNDYYVDGVVGYQYLGPQQVYVRVRSFSRVYDNQFDNSGFERDSIGVRAEAGVTLDLGGLVFADLSAGFQRQAFEDSRFGTVQRPVFGAALLWNPTKLTSVTGDAKYEFAESFNTPSPGYWRATYAVGVQHELRRDLVALGRVSLVDRDYERLDRSDLVYGVDAGLRYRIDRGLFLEGEYRYRLQDTNAPDADYYRNVVWARLRKVF